MRRTDRRALSPLSAALAFAALAVLVTWVWDASGRQITDFELYRRYGEAMASGALPYRDLALEYPPLALPAFVLPALMTGGETSFTIVFAFLMATCGAAAVFVTGRSLVALGRPPATVERVLMLLALSPLVLGPVLLTRFDLVPALAVAGATLSLLRGRQRLSAALLGLGVAAKLWPGALLPLFLVVAWRRRGGREAGVVTAVALGVALAVYLPFLAVAPDGVVDSVTRQLGRPLQIESLGAGILLTLHNAAGMPLDWGSSRGSQNLTGAAAGSLALLLGVAQVAAVALGAALFARGPATPERLVRFCALVIAGVVAFGRVLSPQFLVWPLFAVVLVAGVRGRRAGVLYVVACGLTLGWFPAWYWALVREFDPVGSVLVLARDLALVGMFAVLAWPRSAREGSSLEARFTATRPAPPRSTTPGPSRDRS